MADRIPNSETDGGSPDWDRLARYLAGEASPAEAAEIERWLAADPARARLVTSLDEVLDPALVAPATAVDVEAALARTRARLDGPAVRSIEAARSERAPRTRGPAWRTWALRAAGFAAILAGPYLVYSFAGPRGGREPMALAGPARVVTTETARVDSLFLADGTRVILAPATTLTIHSDYGDGARELTLDGEALFDVVHDESLAFLVHVPGGVVQDLGTAFSVRTESDGGARIVVTEGSVSLRRGGVDDGSEIILFEGDRGTLPLTGTPVAERGTATPEDVIWTRGVLVLRDADIARIDAELTRWYGYRLRVSGTDLADRRLTATFQDETPEQIGEIIALAFGGRREVRGDTIVIHPAGFP